jgi:Ser/Thr protein kinase RdoA (MazF antagonist)
MLGRVSSALADFEHVAASRSHAWDITLFLSVVPPLLDAGALEDVELIRRSFAWYAALVTPLSQTLRAQVIHGDMNDQNVLVSEEGREDEAIGLLDFGDMVRSWRVADPAIACAYLVIQLHYEDRAPGIGEVIRACATLLAGFASAAPLDEDEWSVLPALVLARIATSLVFGAYSAALDPGNLYLSLTHAPGWRALRLLLSVPLEHLQEGFKQAGSQ